MSNTDSFIEEVSEEVRKDALYGYVKKYGWIAALLIVGVVGGAGYFEWSKAQNRAEAEARGDAIIAALEKEAAVDRAAAVEALEAEAGDAAPVLMLQRAAILADDQDKDGAAAILEALANQSSADTIYRDLANYKLVLLKGAEMDATARNIILGELAQPNRPFRPLALEQQALALVGEGETEAAISAFTSLLQEPQISANLRTRVQQTVVALGGELSDGPVLLNGAEATE